MTKNTDKNNGKQVKRIKKILIPNRGEIAVRIQRTCRELNIPTVALFSEPDRHALHVRYADEAYELPGASPRETYLNMDLIFQAAETCGADAVHPGYGFLSENAEFARRCAAHGLTFIGPPPEAMEMMGLKTGAREIMQKAGVPVVPGSQPLTDYEAAQQWAADIGYPVLIKASAGGGGKGMRAVEKEADLRAAFEACRREAGSAFGDPTVYMEKYLQNPRHVEFQVLADHYGNIIHLYERECSVQRRHQKIIEETPSPALDEILRRKMGETAIAAARACNYTNAGTVEFLVDRDRGFYFLEMNTRLQVEHPITEIITGVDLVERQIRIAEGEPLTDTAIPRRGTAMECRIYAEDPQNNFLPSPGKITALINPGGPGVRNDSGVYQGYTIPTQYDPMISKLVVQGENRPQVLRRMLRALEEYRIMGIETNISYLRKILTNKVFMSGDYDTHFIEHEKKELQRDTIAVPLEGPGTGGVTGAEDIVALAAAGLLAYLQPKPECREKTPGTEHKMNSTWKTSARLSATGGTIK